MAPRSAPRTSPSLCVCAILGALALPAQALSEEGKGVHPRYGLLRDETRLVVVYHPDLSSCQPQEMRALRVLNRIESDHAEVEVVTILPEGTIPPTERYGEQIPGRRLQIPGRSFTEEGTWAPRPRIEVWSRDERLLLLMGLHPAVREDRLLSAILWARAFTEPQQQEEAR